MLEQSNVAKKKAIAITPIIEQTTFTANWVLTSFIDKILTHFSLKKVTELF